MRRFPRLDRRRAGFTLVELMVALVIGSLVVAAMFTIGGASARHFQEQQRVGVTQRSVRHAMERVRRDIARAGYGHVAHEQAPGVNTCPSPDVTGPTAAVWIDADLDQGALPNRARNNTTADRLRLIGNYNTADSYLVASIDGDTVYLQTDWLAFRRSFVVGTATSPVTDVDRYQSIVFRSGTMLHIHVPQTSRDFFVHVTGSAIDSGGTNATITIDPSIPLDSECITGYGGQAIVTPLAWIEYALIEAPSDSVLAQSDPDVTGPNTLLVRRQLDMDSGTTSPTVLPGTQRTILEYAVNFDLDFFMDSTPLAPQPTLQFGAGGDVEGAVQLQPWRVQTVVVSLAARTPEQDPRFPWPDAWASARPADAPLNRYQVFPSRDGASRVRALTTEVQLPNLVR